MVELDKSKASTQEAPGGVGVEYPLSVEAGDIDPKRKHQALILLGAPGSGKGTLTRAFDAMLGFSVFASGDALRAEIQSGSALGQEVKALCDKGLLVSDEMVLAMVENFLDSNRKENVVFDGFPRTVLQAEKLSTLLAGWAVRAFYLEVSSSVVFQRMLGRYSCKTCGKLYNDKTVVPGVEGVCDLCGGVDFLRRSDDNEQAIRTRLDVYQEKTAPLVEYYLLRGELLVVDASQPPDVVADAVLHVVLT
ncbi:MAG: nucleoside monophosphate kinase [Holosporales bacterium]|jgi:adenylate kinase|nr:nucleoside monophosphate kinase [Holosporales bacterium]